MKRFFLIPALFLTSSIIYSQTALKNVEEDYFDFLSIQGLIDRPTLNYRTLSDAQWNVKQIEDTDHLWKNNNLGTTFNLLKVNTPSENWYLKGVKQGIFLNVFGPEWYNSFNTTSPYGQNDGALWQGRGYNTSFTTGARLEGYGLELTFKPQLSFSQNMKWDYKTPEGFNSAQYQNLAKEYGYFWGVIDKPQMFGSSPFWTYDWGDTEVRYTWHNLTVGFGTETIWLGPAWINPILHSNNAPSYPKFDIGLRKQKVIIPGLNWDLGFIEGRIWVGRLTESAWYDNTDDNNYRLISGFNASYAPSFIPGFTLGLNKVCLAKWNNKAWKYLNPFYDDNDVSGPGEDQKMSITLDLINTDGTMEVYAELGIDDYLQGGFIGGLSRYPFDTLCFSFGLKKLFYSNINDFLRWEVIIECSSFEEPRNRMTEHSSYYFYGHHQITHGYTNKGQFLASQLGIGGNGQFLELRLFYPKGYSSLSLYRFNSDNIYAYLNLQNNNAYYNSDFIFSISSLYWISKDVSILGFSSLDYIQNPKYDKTVFSCSYNFDFAVTVQYNF